MITLKSLQDRDVRNAGTALPVGNAGNQGEKFDPGGGGSDGGPIDRAAGIANAANDETLYQQLLADFRFSHGEDLEKIKAALDAGDFQGAHRLVHTLKSTANLIGAKILGSAALVIENTVKTHNAIPAEDLWNTLEKEFDAVMAGLAQITPESPSGPCGTGELDKIRALALLQKLEPLIKSYNAGALILRDDIREILGPLGEDCEALIAGIENFDFPEAVETFNRIKEKIFK
jgi:HPt (histidine-containing phosphotransfer) domain-containing protein